MSLLGIIALLGMAPDRIFLFLALGSGGAPADVERTLLPHPAGVDIHSDRLFQRGVHHRALRLSRTLLTRLTPPDQTGAFFGAYAISGTATVLAGADAGQHRHPNDRDPAGRLRDDHGAARHRFSSVCCSSGRATATFAT